MAEEHPREEELHRYFDGELRERRADQVRAHVERCSRCSAEVEGFSKLHGLMLVAADEMADALHPDALYARITSGLHAKPEPSLGERLAMWWEALLEPWQPRGVWVPATVAVGAAAAVLFLARTGDGPTAPRVAERAPAPTESPAPAEPEAPAPLPMMRSEIVQVDFGKNAGTVFEIALGGDDSTPVVWINDEDEE